MLATEGSTAPRERCFRPSKARPSSKAPGQSSRSPPPPAPPSSTLYRSNPVRSRVTDDARAHAPLLDLLACAMLQAGSERPLPAGSMWVPGMSMSPPAAPYPYGGASPSARALEIARRRDEMLGMLHGLPESDYELSLTDLVEKTTAAGAAAGGGNAGVAYPLPLPPTTPPSERKEAGPSPSPLGRPPAGLSESGRQAEQQAAARTERRGSARRRGDSGSGSGRSSFRSSSDGVLLNFYMPRSFTRSFTSPRSSHHAPSAPAAARASSTAIVVPDDSNKRERDSDTVKCWPMPWDRRWRKSSRRDQAGESAAILDAAKHSAAAEEV